MPLPACNPMKAKNKPMPAIVAFIIQVGNTLKTYRRRSKRDIKNEDHTLDGHGKHHLLHRVLSALEAHDGVCKVGVHAHAGPQAERQVRPQGHDQGPRLALLHHPDSRPLLAENEGSSTEAYLPDPCITSIATWRALNCSNTKAESTILSCSQPRIAMQLDPAVAKTRPSNFSPVVLRMLGFTSSDADPATAKKTGNCGLLSPHSSHYK